MGEPLLELPTATMDVEAYVGGFLRKSSPEGDMVAASNPVAILTDTLDEEFDEDLKPEAKVRSRLAGANTPQPLFPCRRMLPVPAARCCKTARH
jgi:hypothetical protein